MRRVAIFLLVLLAVACEHRVTEYRQQPRMTMGPVATPATTRITVHFVRDVDEIFVPCPSLKGSTHYGCATQGPGTCDVYFQQPTDFNDAPRLAVMGHELLHCLGAQHALP